MKYLRAVLGIVCVGLIAAGLAVGCGRKSNDIKVGVILPTSGKLSPFGKSALAGIQQRVKEINAAGGINGKPITLIVEDNKGEATASSTAYKKLVSINKVAAIVGPVTSTNALQVVGESARTKTPTISPTATNDTVAPKSPYMFRACFNDSFQGKVVANYVLQNLQLTKAAVMIDQGSDYSKGLSANFKKAFIVGGGEVVAEEKYQQKDTEFGGQLTKIKDSGAQVLFVPGYPPELPLIIKQAGTMGLDIQLCGADGWDKDAVLQESGDNIIGSIIVGAFAKEDARDAVQNFIKSMGDSAGSFEALGYDSVSMLAAAMQTGTDAGSIKTGLSSIKDFEGVTGKITVLPNGDAEKSAVILSIEKDGDKYVKRYKATINP